MKKLKVRESFVIFLVLRANDREKKGCYLSQGSKMGTKTIILTFKLFWIAIAPYVSKVMLIWRE